MKTSEDIRQAFLTFFEQKGHRVVESAPLVPRNDPTLLFTNAGMVQFKGVFQGDETRPYSRATSSQKCVRAGGKHNDLENVGRTARHHTFFEMLGNFSFGDYFKQDAISMAWEFITIALQLPAAKLWITVFYEDDEAYDIWKGIGGVPESRIIRMGEKDNFWSMGDTGPCGPCSEILIDQGPEFSCGCPDCAPGCDCDRYLELWNLVFMQFNRDAEGNMSPLPRPSIDTGMGLERVAAVIQGAKSNYDTDLFAPLLQYAERISGIRYGSNPTHDVSMRIIADHSRATAFLIADGVLPSNEGRGYVLRRIMRRAARHGKLLSVSEPFLHEAVRIVADQMKAVYPEVYQSIEHIARATLNEEQTFAATLESGLRLLEAEMKSVQREQGHVLPGEVMFKLYDTYGFPADLTADIAREQGLDVDSEGFEQAMQRQRQRARQAWKGSGDEAVNALYSQMLSRGVNVQFRGYDTVSLTAPVALLIKDGKEVSSASAGDDVEIIAPETPFYGESGGQVGDTGTVSGEGFSVRIRDTLKPIGELIVHRGTVVDGKISVGAQAAFQVDSDRRAAIAVNHTTTHIVHSVLRKVLGDHVKQAGSMVTPDRMRFDFTHFAALSHEELRKIEDGVNRNIRRSDRVDSMVLPREEADTLGATALFGEKYGDYVRVVRIDNYSTELCGGTHIPSTGNIGVFKIVSETAVAAGVRRIDAVTGEAACRFIERQQEMIERIAATLKTDTEHVADRVERLARERADLEKEIEQLKSRVISKQADSLKSDIRMIAGVRVLAAQVDEGDPKALRRYGDMMQDRLGSGIIVCASAPSDEKVLLLCMVSSDLAGTFPAGSIIKEIAPVVGGRGGGKAEMAQAGGALPDRIPEALERACAVIEQMGGAAG